MCASYRTIFFNEIQVQRHQQSRQGRKQGKKINKKNFRLKQKS